MDPEDLREVISAYQKCVAETVRRFGGFVAKYMGDGVLVYFGYPGAHEDDAERAVRAGLELIAAVSALKTPALLQTRIGIATGLVVVGDLIGSGSAQEQAIVGETPNLAARLQGIAEPNTVIIAEGTRKLLGILFDLEDLGPKDLKGIVGSVHAWAALRASSVESRFEALHAGGLTALVGREEETELLFRRWSRAKTGEGQVVLLSGEAGIGKSRLTAAVLERLATEPHTRLRYFCSPQHTDSALYPIIGQMERAARFTHDDTPQARLDKFDALLAQTSTSAQDATLFADMLSLPNDGRYPALALSPEQRRQRTLEALTAQRTTATIPSPTLAVPASLHASLMARLDRLGSAKEVAQIGAAIGRQFSHALLAAIAHAREPELQSALDRLVAAGLLFRQGVPPYVSYLFKHALVQDAAYGTLLREPRRALHARIAETIESQFADIAENQPELLARHCAEAGLIEKAAGLWGKAGQRSQARSALVEAVEQFKRALDQIATLPPTPALRREQVKLQVALITPLIHVKGYAAPETKAAAERARLLIEQAEALREPPEDPLLLFSVLYSYWVANFVAYNGVAIRELAARFLSLAEKQRATVPLMMGHRLMASSLVFTGDIAEGRAHYDQAIVLYEPLEHRPLATRFGQDIRVGILSFRSLALWVLGYPEAALADADCALQDAREIGHAATLMYALGNATIFAHLHCGRYTAADAELEQLLVLADEKSALFWKALGTLTKSCLLVLNGKDSDAIQMFAPGIAAYRLTGATLHVPLYLSYLARAHAELGQFDDARRCIDEAITAAEVAKQKVWEAEVHRTVGEIALKVSDPDESKAETSFKRALAISRQQQAKSWELRAAMSLARLWRDQGKCTEACDLLAPIYGWFTEGFDTRDLKEAKALLDALSS
jgi:class 3 adenylate cyclase/predicted ATPase